MISLLDNAIKSRKTYIMYYIDKNGNVSQRFVKVKTRKGNTITAFCLWKKKPRTFSIDNILSIGLASYHKN